MAAICLRLVFLSKLRSLCCVAGGHHRCEVREQLVCVPANVFCLVISPLVSGFILKNDFFRMRPMPKQRSHSHQHRQSRHGQGYRSHGAIMSGMFGMFVQFLKFVSAHTSSLSHYFDDHSLVSLAIELRIENALPWAEIKQSGSNRYDYFVMDQ